MATAKKKKPAKKPKKKNPIKTVTASVAVLSALDAGETTIAGISKGTRMTANAVQQTLGRLRKKEQAKRTNKRGVGVIGAFKLTRAGGVALRRAKKEMGL